MVMNLWGFMGQYIGIVGSLWDIYIYIFIFIYIYIHMIIEWWCHYLIMIVVIFHIDNKLNIDYLGFEESYKTLIS